MTETTQPPLSSANQATLNVLKLTRKDFASDQEVRWCPGCGDYSILAQMKKVMPQLGVARENVVFISGIGCSSRFPYFVQAHGAHFIHGRALPFASGVSLSRPDLHVFAFGGDGDAFSIGGNHFTHTARKNIKMTYVVMDNFVYGLTKKQTSPTSPIGFKSKTDTVVYALREVVRRHRTDELKAMFGRVRFEFDPVSPRRRDRARASR